MFSKFVDTYFEFLHPRFDEFFEFVNNYRESYVGGVC